MALTAPLSRSVFRKQATSPGLVAIPSSLTSVSTKDTLVFQIFVNNTAGTAQTLKVTDAAGVEAISTNVPFPPGPTMVEWEQGVYFVGGVKWQAGASSVLIGEIVAYVHG